MLRELPVETVLTGLRRVCTIRRAADRGNQPGQGSPGSLGSTAGEASERL
ncbi:MAG: hypothetical protein QM758_18970 [Armatimonas sp.]